MPGGVWCGVRLHLGQVFKAGADSQQGSGQEGVSGV